ncbi:metallopeptidase [Pseudoflavonifractor sp. 60]|nr:metallopeptidase [Pseudoflavonifractor sp. 60]
MLSRNTLLVNLRFLDAALSQFALTPAPLPFATDGQNLYYDPRHVLLCYQEEKEASVRNYLHLVMHCVFRHMYVHTLVDQALWDLSCDIAVEEVINGLGLSSAAAKRQEYQAEKLDKLRKEVKQLTAEKLYRYFQDHPPQDPENLRELFRGDDHTPWYLPPKVTASVGGNSGENGNGPSGEGNSGLSPAMEQIWKDISTRMQMDLETFSKRQGDRAGALTQNLQAVNRERYDYTAFLKKFAVRGEVMRLDPDEFDYVYYTYGLKLYRNMPLIEPLEYREVKRIREFVIAIDTSGSTSGDLVQKFVQKTYNVLKSTESFFSKINLHILQCDADIQEDVKITSQEEFDAYIKTMTIKGLGGTDFRPVFAYVDRLRRGKEFQDLKGLIYFTDGYGDFPEKKPDYDAAFVFVEDEYNNLNVPPWAIKLILQKDEI